jgi:hypothetical protein
MPEIAVIARFYPRYAKRRELSTSLGSSGEPCCQDVELQPIVLREKGLSICLGHPRAVWFEGAICPCCQMEAELSKERRNA